ncbi:MAG: LUD domain-containing protein, partial [Planctomycetota bacterium]
APLMNHREEILSRVRLALEGAPQAPLPEVFQSPAAGLTWEDFATAHEEAHGEFRGFVAKQELLGAIEALTSSCGYTHGAAELLGQEPYSGDAEALNGLSWMVATGFYAVARSGAVAVSSETTPLRLQLLLPENLVLLVPEDKLVDDLPEFYAELDPAQLPGGYLTLIAGPSKTADIEQILVTGAHGPKRLVVFAY